MHVHQMNESMLFRTSFYHVVYKQPGFAIRPSKQAVRRDRHHQSHLSDRKCSREKRGTCTKMSADLLDHPIQVLPKLLTHGAGLLPGCSVHRFFPWRSPTIVVNEIVPPVVITTSAITFEAIVAKGNCFAICCPEVLPETARLVNCRYGKTVRRHMPFILQIHQEDFVISLSK